MPHKVSIITPTFGREPFLRLAHRTIAAQTHTDWEWLVLDDSPTPSSYMLGVTDPRVRYRHGAERMKVGRKRNELASEASGTVIAHFDDDDYYAPTYLARMLKRLGDGSDFVKLSGWFVYDVPYGALGYWDTNRKTGRHYMWSPPQPPQKLDIPAGTKWIENVHMGFGFSYVYRTEVWRRHAFEDEAHGWEDELFAVAAAQAFRFAHFRDLSASCVHILHGNNLSRSFPQYVLPRLARRWLFPSALDDYVRP
jgi:glycosyltransferase involved in cell wall biosynthesis